MVRQKPWKNILDKHNYNKFIKTLRIFIHIKLIFLLLSTFFLLAPLFKNAQRVSKKNYKKTMICIYFLALTKWRDYVLLVD